LRHQSVEGAAVASKAPFRKRFEEAVGQACESAPVRRVAQAFGLAANQSRCQRLKPMEKLARMLLDHREGILNCCRTNVPPGVVEAVNGNIKALLRRGRGYRDLNYLLLKAQRLTAAKTQSSVLQKAA
jgi:transposase